MNKSNEALDILESAGIPLENKTGRSLERMAVCFLAVASVTDDWSKASSEKFYKTRDVINYVNAHFEENISSGSYDDIRRKDLKLLVLAARISKCVAFAGRTKCAGATAWEWSVAE